MFEKSTQVLIGNILLRNESCNTVQNLRDKIFRKNLKKHEEELQRVGLDTIELLTSFGYSSLPFVWNSQIARERDVRSIDELWFYVWANHLENTGAHGEHNGEFPEKLNYEQEITIRKIVSNWESELTEIYSTKNLMLYSLCVIPSKDYLIVGMGQSLLEDFKHPITAFMEANPDMLISKTSGYTNRETGEPLVVYNFVAPEALTKNLESYTKLRNGTAYFNSEIGLEKVEALRANQGLIETEFALAAKPLSFENFQLLHKSVLNYFVR